MGRPTRALQPKPVFGRLEFGQVVPCDRCRSTGTFIAVDGKKERCSHCEGRGYHEWRTNAMASNAGSAT